MTKKEAKNNIQDLIRKYEAVKASGKIGKYTEEDTKKDFISPLFKALGWDVDDRNEVTAEEHISGDRVDYGFYLNGQPKFYLETKPLKADLFREDYANQAIHYSWNKGVTWAVLSDFENLIVFNALSPEKSLAGKKYLSFTYEEYLTRFDELWRLSKESFGEDILDKEAEKVGKKLQKVSVTETLSKDLNECREILTNSLSQFNEKVDPYLIDEGVQKLLNRLIFIRCAEDRKIEPPTLIPLLHEWKSSGKVGEVSPYQAMIKKFRELDAVYNSNLFDEHPFEKWDEFGEATEKVINILYGKKNYFEYDFSIIPADVLGNVYENYLGHQLKKSKKEEHLDKNLKKRKEQGIYYTPKFIVDYIVQNALGPVLDKCKSINDLQKVKVFDPACGSGSFLVTAMNFIMKKYEDFGTKPSGLLKIQILNNNIYGVDLDQQAVELARLNLLLNTFDSKIKLPNLGSNIKNGNTLISGTDEELKKYFGKNFRDKKPFNWQEEFPEVFKQGGFNVVVSNPPYISYYSKQAQKLNRQTEQFLREKYKFIFGKSKKIRINSVMFFLEKAYDILKKEGILAFIIDLNINENPFLSIREFISKNMKIKEIVDGLTAFVGVGSGQVIFIASKSEDKDFVIEIKKDLNDEGKPLKSKDLLAGKNFLWSIKENKNLIDKIELNTKQLHELVELHTGVAVYATKKGRDTFIKDQECEKCYPFLIGGKSIQAPYCLPVYDKYLLYDKKLEEDFNDDFDKKYFIEHGSHQRPFNLRKKDEYNRPKIIIRQSDKRLTATYIEEFMFGNYSLFNLYEKNNDKKLLKFLLTIINSRLMTYYSCKKGIILIKPGKNPQIRSGQRGPIGVRQLPIKINESSYFLDSFVSFADKMFLLNKKLVVADENSNEWHKLKDEIAKTDKKINIEVYKLYGLTEKEIKIMDKEDG